MDFQSGADIIAAGYSHTCFAKAGLTQCVGTNSSGELDLPSVLRSGVNQLSAGDSFSCALLTGKFYCWGSNKIDGQDNITQNMVPIGANSMQWNQTTKIAAVD